tara:strand:- start:889 stop:1764 length:876 start_codon:yes stop_codon:yes gene_type:complete
LKILITGSNGQVGTALLNRASKLDYQCIPINRKLWDMAKNPENGNEIILEIKPDLVINTAAYTNVDDAENNKILAHNVNSVSPKFLAKGCEKLGIPILHISTDFVFDGTKGDSYVETDFSSPINVYGASKLAGELAIQSETKNSLFLRTSWIFSKSKKNFATSILSLVNSQQTINVVNDQFGCPTSSDCVASTILKIIPIYIKNIKSFSGLYHYGGMPVVSRYEFAKYIISSAKLNSYVKLEPCSSKNYNSQAKRPINTAISSKKINSVFNVSPCNWKKELTRYFNNFQII